MATPEPPQGTIRFDPDGYVSIYIEGGLEEVPDPFIYPSGARMVASPGGHDGAGAGHCIKAVRMNPPTTFELTLEGNVCSSLSATVRLSRDAVRQLPLIEDLTSSTLCHTEKQSAEDTSPRERSTKFQPPCGIWSLVALLQLLEAGCQKSDVTKWVREPSHPALAGQALQMADYLGARQMVDVLCECFRDIFDCLREGPAVPNGEYLTMVLWHLPETLCKDVLTDKVSVAVALQKQDIAFAKWLQGIGSSLDLRDTSPTNLFPNPAAGTINKVVRCLVNCQNVTEVWAIATHIFPPLRTVQYQKMPCPVGGVQTLHIDKIALGEVHDIFLSAPDPLGFLGRNLTSLSIDAVVPANGGAAGVFSVNSCRAAERWMFFRSISKLRNLKRLCISKEAWADLTAYGMDVTAPLQQLDGFEVADVSDGSFFEQVVACPSNPSQLCLAPS